MGDNLGSYCAVTMLREDDLDEAKETAETKGELSCEDVYAVACKTYRWACSSDYSERVA